MEVPAPRPVDDEGLPRPPPLQGRLSRRLLALLAHAENAFFLSVAVALMIVVLIVFVSGVRDLVLAPSGEALVVTVTRAVNSALFIVVVLELVRTIVARLEGGGFQLQPFLVIGIISATRDILTVGAELSLAGDQASLTPALTELGVNAAVVLALSVALVLVRRFARLDRV
ncbi:MAG: phosphate-starvation-inducible PsiE family protein [Streptosporangiaceae bacterium]